MSSPESENAWPWARRLGALLLALGAWNGVQATRALTEARASAAWTRAEATIESNELVRHDESHRGYAFTVELSYRYTVDGTAHRGRRHSVAGPLRAGNRAEAESLAAEYEPGSTHDVFYDPADPGASTLTREGSGRAWTRIGLAVGLMGVGVWSMRGRARRGVAGAPSTA